MRVTRVAYAVDGWGVGELWLGDGRIVLAHEAPHAPRTTPTPQGGRRGPLLERYRGTRAQDGDDFVSDLVRRIHSFFAGEPVDVRRRRARPRAGARRSRHAVASRAPRSAVGRGRLLRRAGRARRLPAGRACGRQLLRAQPVLPARPLPPRRRRGRDRLVRLARRRLQAPPPPRSRAMPLSEDLRNELAAIAPKRGCCRLAEVSALFHSAGSVHLRGRGEVALHLDLASAAVGAARVLAPAGARDPLGDPHLPPAGVRPGDALPAPRRRRRARARDARRGRRARLAARAARAAAPARRRTRRAAAAPTSAARCSAAARSPGRARRISSCEPRRSRAPSSSAPSRRPTASGSACSTAAATRSRTRRGLDAIEALLAAAGRHRHRARARGARRDRGDAGRGEPAGERRPREPRPHEPRRRSASSRRVRALQRRRRARRACPSGCTRSPACAFATRASPCASWRAKCDPPTTKASVHRRLNKLVELAER